MSLPVPDNGTQEVSYMRKNVIVVALLLATAATVFAFDRCVVLEEAYQEG